MINENEELFRIENNTLNAKSIYMSKVYLLVAISFVPIVLALSFIDIPSNIFIYIGLGVAFIVLFFLIVLFEIRKRTKVAYLLLLLFLTTFGVIMNKIIKTSSEPDLTHNIFSQAFLLTAIIFTGMSFLSIFLKDVKFLGQVLFGVIFSITALVIINIFVHLTMCSFIGSEIFAIIFSLYILYKTKNAADNTNISVVTPVTDLYLEFICIFLTCFPF